MEWQNLLYSALSIIITGLVTWAVERLIAFLNSKIKDSKAAKFLSDAITIVANAVKSTYQTYVENLKQNQTFDASAQDTALYIAINQVQNQMSTELKKYITDNFGDLTNWITSQIEAKIYDLKNKLKNFTKSGKNDLVKS